VTPRERAHAFCETARICFDAEEAGLLQRRVPKPQRHTAACDALTAEFAAVTKGNAKFLREVAILRAEDAENDDEAALIAGVRWAADLLEKEGEEP
jgi:hypothetical protein